MNKEFFPLRVSFHLTMFGNYRPRVDGTDDGIWRRVVLVPWEVSVPVEERDFDLLRKLKAEGSGILNRLLDGLRDYLDHGLVLPEVVQRPTDDYRVVSDPLGRFLEVCTANAQGERMPFGAGMREGGGKSLPSRSAKPAAPRNVEFRRFRELFLVGMAPC